MRWFNNLSTRSKLLLTFGLMFLLLAVVTVVGAVVFREAQRSQLALFEEYFVPALELSLVTQSLYDSRVNLLTMMSMTDRADQEAYHERLRESSSALDQRLADLRDGASGNLLERIEELEALRDVYIDTRDNEVVPLIYEGNIEEAREISLGIQAERLLAIDEISTELMRTARERAAAEVERTAEWTSNALRIFLVLGGVALLVGIGLALFLDRILAGPLRDISDAAQQIALGDLRASVPTSSGRDEVAVLARTFHRMTLSLQEMAEAAEKIAAGDLRVNVVPQSEKDILGRAFATMVENLRRMLGELSEAVNVLSSTSSEILAAASQVAASAAETATAVTETTTTVEEVKQTAQVSSDKAREVSEQAQRGAQIARSGTQAVEESLQGMLGIREQMETIAETIAGLSERSQAIGEIMAVVNDLAEQANLLAVNAAIEAAKAGDHGRGFAVVAQEVKSLADQSKQATAQVRTILNQIQKAMGAAVMAAEQGTKSADAGVRQAAVAGETIQTLSESIAEAAQIATQIAASSRQQLAGMDQVATAMENIRQAAAPNVAATKQTEVAARNLHDLGQTLKPLVAQYRL